ncbi:MAG: endolytic transglycosylase MltG [Salibacteraceae bacterium]
MNLKRFSIGLLLALCIGGLWLGFEYYQRLFAANVNLDVSSVEFYIASDDDFKDVLRKLYSEGIISDTASFRWTASKKGYTGRIKPGRYILLDGMSNNELVNLLRSGAQKPIVMVLRSVRTKNELAAMVSRYIEADSADIHSLLNNENFCRRYGFNTETIMTMFIPNSYEFYWNTSAEGFFERMAREYKRFWTDERKARAAQLGLTQSEVSILASIVQAEQMAHPDERPRVAGLYLNRLRKGMRLESDPTLVFALGDFSIKRVLNQHKAVNSTYNTYRNKGLPPGPILLPEPSSIDAVLNAEKHDYLYMCARDDFSGYHHFSRNYTQHLNYARAYQRALNQRKIYR